MNKRIGIPSAVVRLTEAQREELARKAAEANRRSEDNARAKHG
ncbi:hypothetical protein [Streptomyces violaceusniger]|uniref:Uncharacterized protein n=1 Tax=Streptomyces violaceusniger (strain Tu 4113) TaxID=653045 RepID=G2PBI4_STRV4|nr:hypothetical protein [Streptomyces violaceusniger]AEM80606.1 hypothetical protein Strvi_0835 [Streptomyces violaceusniger Tu 4113]